MDNQQNLDLGQEEENGGKKKVVIIAVIVIILAVILSLVCCGKKEEPAPAPAPAPVAEEPAPAPEPEPAAPAFDPSKLTAVNAASKETLSDNGALQSALDESFAAAEKNDASTVEFPAISGFFELGSAELSSSGRSMLRTWAQRFISTNKSATIFIEGYACNIGSNKVNDKLSKERAEVAKAELMSNGVPEANIEIKWYGKRMFKKMKFGAREQHRRINLRIK